MEPSSAIARVAAAIAWVAIYSYLVEPGWPVTEYERYARGERDADQRLIREV